MGQVVQDIQVYEVEITTSATPDYADLDQVGTPVALTGVKKGLIKSIVVIDRADQAPILDILFFKSEPTFTSSDNGALAMSDANAALFLGKVAVVAADYQDFNLSRCASVANIDLPVKATGNDLYVQVQAGGAYNAASTADLALKIGMVRG
jgi:hypothetical protein